MLSIIIHYTILKLISPFKEPGANSRTVKKVKHYIDILYPEIENVNWEQEIAKLLNKQNETLA